MECMVLKKWLVKLIRQHSGVNENLLRDIKIFDDFSYISVPLAEADVILKKFGKKRGRPIISKAKQTGGYSTSGTTPQERGRAGKSKQHRQGKDWSKNRNDRQEKRRRVVG